MLLITLMLLASTYLVFHRDLNRRAIQFIHTMNTSRSSVQQLFRINRDLSAEFGEAGDNAVDRFNVLEALKRDGYTPVAVSKAVVNIPRLESTIVCSNVSQTTKGTTQPTNVTQNPLRAGSKELNNDSSSNNRCNPVDGQGNSMQNVKVPNVVHYVVLGSDLTFTFINYLSYRSVDRFIRPDQIFVHGDHTPSGKWWNRTIDEVKNIYHVKRKYSDKAPNGIPFKFPAHISDYVRAEILLSK